MKTDKQRTLIGAACGRFEHSFFCPTCQKNIRYYEPLSDEERQIARNEISGAGYHQLCGSSLETVLPNYTSDLNAMHDAEKKLTEPQQWKYFQVLMERGGDSFDGKNVSPATAVMMLGWSAEAKAEAFLKAIGKWEE